MVRINLGTIGGRKGGKGSEIAGRVFLTIFGLFFFLIGSFFEVMLVREFVAAVSQLSWQQVDCTIVSSSIEEGNDDESPYVFKVRYTYEINGKTYNSDVYKDEVAGFKDYSKAQRLVEKYSQGAVAKCFVNPERHSEAVIKRSNVVGLAALILFPMIFVLIGAACIYAGVSGKSRKKKAIAPSREQSKVKQKGPKLLFAIFALVGLGLMYPLGIRPISKTIDANNWVEVPCKVIRAQVRSHRGDDSTTYSVDILYEYSYEGKTYRSNKYNFIGGSSSGYEGKRKVVDRYKKLPNPMCFVNPKNPSESVLLRGFHLGLLLVLFPLVFALVGIIGFCKVGKGSGGIGSRAKKTQWLPQQQAKDADARERIDVLQTSYESSGASEDQVVLKPSCSRKALVKVIFVIALIWNTIFFVIAFKEVGSSGSLFSILKLLPFILVGLVMIGAFVYFLLASFNPEVELKLRPGAVRCGEAMELEWRFIGQTGRISELTIHLEGREEATYRRGTNTRTDKQIFFEEEIFRETQLSAIGHGQIGMLIPLDTMHSFEAENNKIVWRLRVRGDIARWPDVRENFKITVLPANVEKKEHGDE